MRGRASATVLLAGAAAAGIAGVVLTPRDLSQPPPVAAPPSTVSVEEAALPSGSGERPVLLVPGWFDTARDLAALRIRLVAAGWPSDQVEAVTFRSPTGGNREHAEEIDSAAHRIVEATGAAAIDIVAHSMGGLATRWYLLSSEHVPVRRVVFLASPHRGTYAAYLAWGEGGDEMMPDSPFLDTLNAAPPVPAGVEAITIRTPFDTRVIPNESATLPGIPDEEVCCPTHEGLLDDLDAFRIVRDFLDRGIAP